MDPLPLVSVVIPTRNRAALLRDCIESLLNQAFPAECYEIVVVDDGSSDETPSVVQEIRGGECPSVQYVRSKGRGLNVARDDGLRTARADLIAFVDDDVLAPDTWLKALAEGSSRHPSAECFGGAVRLRLEGRAPRMCEIDRLDGGLDLGDSERAVDFVGGCNMALRRASVARVGTFDETLSGYGDEAEWELRLLQSGGQIVYLPDAWVWHRRTARDLRPWRLLRSWFRRGAERAAFQVVVGERSNLRQELGSIPRFIGHAILRRCAGGLLSASFHAGNAWGIVRLRLTKQKPS